MNMSLPPKLPLEFIASISDENAQQKRDRKLTPAQTTADDTSGITADFALMSSPSRQVCHVLIRKFTLYQSID